jgi:excisionase family DNA binding protein
MTASPAPRHRPPQLLTVAEVAELLHVSRMTVYRLVNTGDLQAYRIGHTVRIKPADFHAFMRGAAMSDLWQDER